MKQCNKCRIFYWTDTHECPPLWTCFYTHDKDFTLDVHAPYAELAAEQFIEDDTDKYWENIQDDCDGVISVTVVSQSNVKSKFDLTVECDWSMNVSVY